MSRVRLRSVFEKIGGEEKLQEILRDFYSRMSKDILIGFFFSGKDIISIADRQKDFLLFAVGLRPHYSGKTPTLAHLEMPPILKGHFDRRLLILRETLESYHLTEEDILTWIEFEGAFREVVEAKKD